jgi:hypothetical protein
MSASESGADYPVTVGRWAGMAGWHGRIPPEVRATIADHATVQYNMKDFSRLDTLRNIERWPQSFDEQQKHIVQAHTCKCQNRVRVVTPSSNHMQYGSLCIILAICSVPFFCTDYHGRQKAGIPATQGYEPTMNAEHPLHPARRLTRSDIGDSWTVNAWLTERTLSRHKRA